jgi:hypothetical protein
MRVAGSEFVGGAGRLDPEHSCFERGDRTYWLIAKHREIGRRTRISDRKTNRYEQCQHDNGGAGIPSQHIDPPSPPKLARSQPSASSLPP